MNFIQRFPRFLRDPFSWGPWIFLAVAIWLQMRAGLALLAGDLAEADPPAHFATGVMLHDFLQSGHFMRPLPFAECFYVQYPKVALGHWPPVFYVAEALWFFPFGTTTIAARSLCACITGGCALVLYGRCRVDWGRWHALVAAAFFLGIPIVRRQTWSVMSDLLLAGLAFLAICSLSDFLMSGKLRDALWLAAWTILAILTKGTGWLLIIVIAAAPLITGRRSAYANWRFWLAISLTWITSAPFFILASALGLGYPLKMAGHLHRLVVIVRRMTIVNWFAVGGAFLGIAFMLRRWMPRQTIKSAQTTSMLLVLWGLTLIGFINLVPLTGELNRYYIAALAPAACLLAGALVTLERRLDSKLFRYAELLFVLGCAVAFVLIPVRFISTSVFSRTMDAIPVGKVGQIILIEGDTVGEGALIAARLAQDRNHFSHFVRGSKFLASSEWDGAHYKLNYKTPDAMRAAIDSIPLDYLVLDRSAPPTPDLLLMEAVMANSNSRWNLISDLPVTFDSRHGEILVYRRESQSRRGEIPESVQLRPGDSKILACQALQGGTQSRDPQPLR